MQTVSNQIKELLISNKEILIQADASTDIKKNGICFDGIIDESCFNKQAKKVIFLLKETNGNDDKGNKPNRYDEWDYRSWLQHQQANNEPGDERNSQKFYYKTFNNVCMWLDVFYDTLDEKDISYEEYMLSERFTTDTLRKNLNKTAIVNLKKTWGSSSTDCKSLINYLQSEEIRKVLREEIKLISPDVVLCGSADWCVFECAKNIYGSETQQLEVSGSQSIEYFCVDNTIFIPFYHPAARNQRKYLYDYSANIFKALHAI